MSAVDGTVPAPEQRRGLPFGATVYLAVVGALAAVAAIPALQGLTLETPGWPTFPVLTGGAAIAQLFTVRTRRNTRTTRPPSSWCRRRAAPGSAARADAAGAAGPGLGEAPLLSVVQTFNMVAYTLAVLALRGVALTRHLVADGPGQLAARVAVAGDARRRGAEPSCRADGRADAPLLAARDGHLQLPRALDRVRAGGSRRWPGVHLGAEPWLVPFVLAPLLIVNRSLTCRRSRRRRASTPRPGSSTRRHFNDRARDEFGRAQRFVRPLSS